MAACTGAIEDREGRHHDLRPEVDFGKLAQAFGVYGEGRSAIRTRSAGARARAESREERAPALVDVVCQLR